MRKIILVVALASLFGFMTKANAQLFLSFIDVDNAAEGNIQVLTPMTSDNKCFKAAITLVEDGETDVFDMTADQANLALGAAGIKPGLYKIRFSGSAGKGEDKNITISSTKKGEDRDNNKGKNKSAFAFKIIKFKQGGFLVMKKRSEKIVCVTDKGLEIGNDVVVSMSSGNRKALKQFGINSTIFNLPVGGD